MPTDPVSNFGLLGVLFVDPRSSRCRGTTQLTYRLSLEVSSLRAYSITLQPTLAYSGLLYSPNSEARILEIYNPSCQDSWLNVLPFHSEPKLPLTLLNVTPFAEPQSRTTELCRIRDLYR